MTKKLTIVLLFLTVITNLNAGSGDTSKILTHNKVVIKTNPAVGVTNYPAWGVFPNGNVSYRKVYLYLEFGCAPGLTCGEWDYGNHIYLERKGGLKGDTMHYELARFITPYGKYWDAASKWKHGWYFDLTDFSFLLHDSLEIVYQHSGYESNTDRGWTVTMQFNCIEGTPELQPMGITKFFEVNAPFGSATNLFKDNVPDKTFTVKPGADLVRFKTIQTGHGMDKQENCAEFCNKLRTVKLDNNVIEKASVWRDDCGLNSLYPQAGTWLYDRANWCPGSSVKAADVEVKLAENTQHVFSLDMESYINTTGGSANYNISSYAMHFKDNRKQRDAAIDDILAPSTHFEYLRLNPECGAPILNVKNSGTDTIKTLYFEYGKFGGNIQYIEVHCNIPPFRTNTVTLESIYNWSGAGNTFYAKILKVNNQPDENSENNIMYSKIVNTLTWPDKIIIVLNTNNAASENYYKITDSKGKVYRNKGNFSNNKLYRDTVALFTNVCYKFELFDDGPGPASNPLNKDGLGWWNNADDGNGSIQIRSGLTGALLKNYNIDFGTKIMQNFYTTYSMGVTDHLFDNTSLINIAVKPNPSTSITNFSIDFNSSEPAQIYVYDAAGKLVYDRKSSAFSDSFSLQELVAGMYSIVVVQGNSIGNRKFIVQ